MTTIAYYCSCGASAVAKLPADAKESHMRRVTDRFKRLHSKPGHRLIHRAEWQAQKANETVNLSSAQTNAIGKIVLDCDLSDLEVSPRRWWDADHIEDWNGFAQIEYASVEAADQDKHEQYAYARDAMSRTCHKYYGGQKPRSWLLLSVEGRWAKFEPVR